LDKKKKKDITVGNSEIVDCFEHLEDIEVYESSSHEEGKRLFKMSIRTNIFYILPLLRMPTMRQKKKNSIFKFSTRKIRRKRILTYKSRRRFEDTQKFYDFFNILVSTTENIFDGSSKKNELSISTFSLRSICQHETNNFFGVFNDCAY